MADKSVTVAVPEERVPEFYAWFAAFLATEAGTVPRRGAFGPRGRHHGGHDVQPWTAQDARLARWLYEKLAPPARALFDLLLDEPEHRYTGNEIATRLGLEKGAHGVAGILAWPGRYARKIGRPVPVVTSAREDGGTDYAFDPAAIAVFEAARRA